MTFAEAPQKHPLVQTERIDEVLFVAETCWRTPNVWPGPKRLLGPHRLRWTHANRHASAVTRTCRRYCQGDSPEVLLERDLQGPDGDAQTGSEIAHQERTVRHRDKVNGPFGQPWNHVVRFDPTTIVVVSFEVREQRVQDSFIHGADCETVDRSSLACIHRMDKGRRGHAAGNDRADHRTGYSGAVERWWRYRPRISCVRSLGSSRAERRYSPSHSNLRTTAHRCMWHPRPRWNGPGSPCRDHAGSVPQSLIA